MFDLKEGDFPKGSKFVQSERFGKNALVVIVPQGKCGDLNPLGFKSHVIKTIDGVAFEEVELPGQANKPEPLRECVYLRWKVED